MKKIVSSVVSIGAIVLLAGWGTPESNVAGNKKHSINFFGTYQSWANQDRIINIENLSIDNLFKQIPMLLKPTIAPAQKKQANAAQAAQDAATAARKAAKAAKRATQTSTNAAAIADVVKAAQAAADAAAAAADAVMASIPKGKIVKPKEYRLEKNPRKTLVEAKIDLAEVSEIRVPFPDELWIYQESDGSRKQIYLQVDIISNDFKKTKASYLLEKRKKVYCDRINKAGPEEWVAPLQSIKSIKVEGYKDRELEESKRRREEEKRIIKKLQRTSKTSRTSD